MRGCGRSQSERSMWPVGVVMLDVDAQGALELSATCDQEPVKTFTADCSDPAFSERVGVRRAKRRADYLDALALEDVVESAAELAVAVADQEPDRPRPIRERPGKLASLLGCPPPIRVGTTTSEMNAAAAEFDEEEDVQAAEPQRFDGEEVAGDHRGGIRTKELAPVELGASAGRRDACVTEDLGNRRGRDLLTDPCELADDPLVAPARILTRKPQHQLAKLRRDRRPTRSTMDVGPSSPHQSASVGSHTVEGARATFPSSRRSSSLDQLHSTRGRTEMGANISTLMVVVALATGLWWGMYRTRRSAVLDLFSMTALVLAAVTLLIEGVRWPPRQASLVQTRRSDIA